MYLSERVYLKFLTLQRHIIAWYIICLIEASFKTISIKDSDHLWFTDNYRVCLQLQYSFCYLFLGLRWKTIGNYQLRGSLKAIFHGDAQLTIEDVNANY